MEKVNVMIALIAGILSIFSPCIIPVLPSFIGYITGVSLSDQYKNLQPKHLQLKLLLNTLAFAIGFSLIFLIFGAVIGILGKLLIIYQPFLQKIGGIIIIIFGLQLIGVLKLKFLIKERKIELSQKTNLKGYLRSFFIGIFFAFGWAPCYGPVIGTILTLAASSTDFNLSLLLFFFYSLGFLIPLVIISLFIGQTSKFFKKHPAILKYSSIISGLLVILLGILLFTNQLNVLVNWFDLYYTKNNLYSLEIHKLFLV